MSTEPSTVSIVVMAVLSAACVLNGAYALITGRVIAEPAADAPRSRWQRLLGYSAMLERRMPHKGLFFIGFGAAWFAGYWVYTQGITWGLLAMFFSFAYNVRQGHPALAYVMVLAAVIIL